MPIYVSPPPTTLLATPTFEADIQGHPGQRGIDDVAQVDLLLLVEVKLPTPTRGKPERNELLSMEAIEWLYRERDIDEKGTCRGVAQANAGLGGACVPITSTFLSFSA